MMNTLTQADIRNLLRAANVIKETTLAMRKEVRIPTYMEVYSADNAVDEIHDTLLRLVEAEPWVAKRIPTVPATQSAVE